MVRELALQQLERLDRARQHVGHEHQHERDRRRRPRRSSACGATTARRDGLRPEDRGQQPADEQRQIDDGRRERDRDRVADLRAQLQVDHLVEVFDRNAAGSS